MDLDTRDIVITHAKRTAIGSFCGSISSLSASQLGAIVISDLLSDSNINANEVSAVIAGQVLSGGCGQNPARQSSIGSGLSESVPAWLVKRA
jgi:acetyl-CoA C-acetyltransferase